MQPGRQLIPERNIPIRSPPQPMSVDPNLAVAVNAIEVDIYPAPGSISTSGMARIPETPVSTPEHLSVPSDPRRQTTLLLTRRILLAETPLDAPVMRQIHPSPAHPRRVRPQMKLPAAIKALPLPQRSSRPRLVRQPQILRCRQRDTPVAALIYSTVKMIHHPLIFHYKALVRKYGVIR